MLYWVVAAATILCSFTYRSEIGSLKPNLRRIGVTALAVTVLVATIAGMLNLYVSPIEKQPGVDVSVANWNGITWFYGHKGSGWTMALEPLTISAPLEIFGPASAKLRSSSIYEFSPPLHLGYSTNNASLSSQFGSNGGYLVVTDRTREYKSQLWPNNGVYTLSDLNRVDNDTSVTKFFSNGETDIYWAA